MLWFMSLYYEISISFICFIWETNTYEKTTDKQDKINKQTHE